MLALAGALALACGPLEADDPAVGGGLVPVLEATEGGETTEEERRLAFYHSFGPVPDNHNLEHVFRLRNADPVPITILRVQAACGCTVPVVRMIEADGTVTQGSKTTPNEVLRVPPEALVEITFRVNTGKVTKKNADTLLRVSVATDAQTNPFFHLEAHLKVTQPFKAFPPVIDLGNIPRNVGGTGSTQIRPLADSTWSLDHLLELPDNVDATLEWVEQAVQPHWLLEATLSPPLKAYRQSRTLEIATLDASGNPGPPYQIDLVANPVPDLSFEPQRVFLRQRDLGEAVESEVLLLSRIPGHTLKVTGHRFEGPRAEELSLEIEGLGPAGNASDRLQLRVGYAGQDSVVGGALSGKIILTLDDSQYPEVSVPYVLTIG